jgi:hypothetical protein
MYHKNKIIKGEIGKSSKIKEELDELIDAELQNNKILKLIELSDIIGSIKCYLESNFDNFTLDDLIKFAELTNESFKDGTRK